MSAATTYRPGTVVSYAPSRKQHDPMWCREGMAIANKRGALVDTYWGTGTRCRHVLRDADELSSVEVLFHLDDYRELDDRNAQNAWQDYRPEDRQRITSQHGLQSRYFVRRGAEPDLSTRIENAQRAVADAESDLASAKRRLDWRREELAQLEAQR